MPGGGFAGRRLASLRTPESFRQLNVFPLSYCLPIIESFHYRRHNF